MYAEKIEELLLDLENSRVNIAGGSTIGMVLSITNALITYVSNLTIGKKNYQDVEFKVKEILKRAKYLKKQSLELIDKDKIMLDKILDAYKTRKQNEENYQNILKEAVEFCEEVLNISLRTLSLTKLISKVGNKMLESDFKICMYYAIASVMSAVENIKINLKDLKDLEYKNRVESKCNKITEKYYID